MKGLEMKTNTLILFFIGCSITAHASSYTGNYEGIDTKGKPCSVEVIRFDEVKDASVRDSSIDRNSGRTNLKRTITCKVSFQKDKDTTFTAHSGYDTMWNAYDSGRLFSQNNSIGKNRYESVTLFINDSHVRSIYYNRNWATSQMVFRKRLINKKNYLKIFED